MRRHEPELAAAGATLAFVSTGTPAMARDFQQTHGGGHVVLSDVGRQAFAAAGMKRSLFATLHWRMLRNAWRAMRNGFRQAGIQGDPWQQGGVLVFGPLGDLRHQQNDAAGGDELDLDAIVTALGAVG